MNVYLVPNLKKVQAVQAAGQAARILQANNVRVLLDEQLAAACAIAGAEYLPCGLCRRQADVIVTIGGDGTILHEAGHPGPDRRPILGVNLGRCGFLATCEVEQLEEKLSLLAQGRYQLDTRILLDASVAGEPPFRAHALNDIVVARGRLQQAIEFSISCDGIPVEHYRGDGVIVATPTGSTAYSLSAGGPILDAQTKAIVVTPICPHSMQSPAVVFAPERHITIRVGELQERDEVFFSYDGTEGCPLHTGSVVEICLSDKTVQLVTFGAADQFQAIDQKLKNRT